MSLELLLDFGQTLLAGIYTKHPTGLSCLSRYGLPVNFQAVLLQPHKKSATKRLREVLNSVFRHLDEVAAASILDVGIMGMQMHHHHRVAWCQF